MDKTLWTPSFYGRYDFGIYLDRDFALEMIQAKIPAERQTGMNKVAKGLLNVLGIDWSNPYTFHQDSGFISNCHIGQNGVWLSTNHQTIEDLLSGKESSKPIEYHSHNVDAPRQAHVLMVLFGKWVDYADALRKG